MDFTESVSKNWRKDNAVITAVCDAGVPHPDKLPGGRMAAQTWTGDDGYLYLYGGHLLGGVSRSDMWRLRPPVFDETSVADWAVY